MNNNSEIVGLCSGACLLRHYQADKPLGLGPGLEIS